MFKGQLFSAYHKNLGLLEYKYIKTENTNNSYNIHLQNLTNNTDAYVESEWFNQRKITLH